jgi:hypothetical protein
MTARPLQSLSLRQAIVERLRADSDLTDLVPADRIHGMRTPASPDWPFVRYGTPDEVPLRRGTEIRVTLHGFSKEQFEDEASSIVGALQADLEDAVIELPHGLKAFMRFVGAQIVPDAAEASAWHGIASWTATIA